MAGPVKRLGWRAPPTPLILLSDNRGSQESFIPGACIFCDTDPDCSGSDYFACLPWKYPTPSASSK